MSDALKRLIDAVEAGTATGGDDAIAVPMDKSSLIIAAIGDDDEKWANLVAAHDGDLNSAKSLHDALLPGWTICIGQNAHHGDWNAFVRLVEDGRIAKEYYGGTDDNGARAALLAILRAYQQVQP